MKYIVMIMLVLGVTLNSYAKDGFPDGDIEEYQEESQSMVLDVAPVVSINAVGQGVAPSFATSPAQAFALAKRAATADAYRLIAERVKGVRIEGKDTIKNMAIKSSVINTRVEAMVRNAKIVETVFKDGMCEVELEVTIDKNSFR